MKLSVRPDGIEIDAAREMWQGTTAIMGGQQNRCHLCLPREKVATHRNKVHWVNLPKAVALDSPHLKSATPLDPR